MAKRCKHVGRSGCVVSMDTIKHTCDVVPPEHHGPDATGRGCMQYQTCARCGEWLSLGPAKDDGPHAEAVAIEARAAELAATDEHWYRLITGGVPGEDDEVDGCLMTFSGESPRTAPQIAGYLARCIAEHDKETP